MRGPNATSTVGLQVRLKARYDLGVERERVDAMHELLRKRTDNMYVYINVIGVTP